MIVELEKLKKARTAVGVHWTTVSDDNLFRHDVLWLSDLLRDVIDDLELGGESIIELNREGGSNDRGSS